MTYHHPNDKIYKVNVPREYLLSNIPKTLSGKYHYINDIKLIQDVDEGKTIGEGIALVSHDSMLPIFTETCLCRQYLRIIKKYMHEYNLTKKRM